MCGGSHREAALWIALDVPVNDCAKFRDEFKYANLQVCEIGKSQWSSDLVEWYATTPFETVKKQVATGFDLRARVVAREKGPICPEGSER